MNAIDIQNAFEVRNLANNFTVQLLRLIAKSDGDNRLKLARGYPAEVVAVGIFQDACPYKELEGGGQQVDYDKINELAHEFAQVKPGETGNFPDGKVAEDDEGELRMGVGVDTKNKLVVMDFGKAIKWFALNKEQTLELAGTLVNHASSL
jgi:hypothetical protein